MNSEIFGLMLSAFQYFISRRLGSGFSIPGLPHMGGAQGVAQPQAPTPAGQAPQPPAQPTMPQGAGAALDANQVASMLDQMASERGEQLNWRNSTVDLMKTLGLDSGIQARKKLASDFGRSNFSGSSSDNDWLHGQVMGQLSQHGLALQQQNPAPSRPQPPQGGRR